MACVRTRGWINLFPESGDSARVPRSAGVLYSFCCGRNPKAPRGNSKPDSLLCHESLESLRPFQRANVGTPVPPSQTSALQHCTYQLPRNHELRGHLRECLSGSVGLLCRTVVHTLSIPQIPPDQPCVRAFLWVRGAPSSRAPLEAMTAARTRPARSSNRARVEATTRIAASAIP